MPEPEMGKRPYMSLAVGAMQIPDSPCLKREPEPMRAIIMGAPLLIWQPRTAELSIPLSCNSCDNPPGFRLDFKHSFRQPLARTIIQFEPKMVTPTGLEPVTSRLGISRSILMSYGAAMCIVTTL